MTLMTLTLADRINMEAELDRYEAPPHIRRVFNTVFTLMAGNRQPPADLLSLLQGWLQRQMEQNRYGK